MMACSSYAVRFLFSLDWPAGLPTKAFSASWLLPHWFFLFLAVEDSLVLSPAEKEGPCQFLIPREVRGKHGSPAPQIIQQALAAVLLRLVKTFGQWLRGASSPGMSRRMVIAGLVGQLALATGAPSGLSIY